MIRSLRLLALLSAFAAAPRAWALGEAGAKQVIDKFLASQPRDQGMPEPYAHRIADLDGNGRPDLVLVWLVTGPTSAWPKLTLFLDNGKTYRALTADLYGLVEGLEVKGSNIHIATLMPGPKDPRCCPTVKRRITMSWQGGRLVELK
jgi:hypothetical protein